MSKITGKVNYKEVLKGDIGYTFEPHVTVDGILYWTNNGNLENPLPVNIRGKQGEIGRLTEEQEQKIDRVINDYNDAISNLTNGNENATNSEIVQARNGEVNLNRRLDKFDSQLNNMVKQKGFISYEDFGAIGDGITDDSEAIKNAHIKANELKLRIFCPNAKTYYIASAENIYVKTDVDFNNCKIIIEDGNLTTPIFNIINDNDEITINNPLITVNKLTRGIDSLSGYGKCFIQIIDENTKVYKREGVNANNGESMTEFNIIDNNGRLSYLVNWDFTTVTKVKLRPFNDNYITIKNCNFITKVSNIDDTVYNQRGIKCSRNSVIFDNINHHVLNDNINTRPSFGFLMLNECADVLIKNTKIAPRVVKTIDGVPQGTYGLTFFSVLDVYFENFYGFSDDSKYWGIIGGNYGKNLKFYNCILNRIDSHLGSFNVDVEKCIIGNKGLTLTGGGRLNIKNVDCYAPHLISLRSDYGGTWDGDIFIENIRHIDGEVIISADNNQTWDYGVPSLIGRNIISIKNYEFIRKNDKDIMLLGCWISGDKNNIQHNTYIADKLVFDSIRVRNGKGITTTLSVDLKNLKSYKEFKYTVLKNEDNHKLADIMNNVEVLINNIDYDIKASEWGIKHHLIELRNNSYGNIATDNYLSNAKDLVIKFDINDCSNLLPSVYGLPFILNIKNSSIVGFINSNGGSRCKVNISNCSFIPNKTSGSVAIRSNKLDTKITDSVFNNTSDGYINSPSTLYEVYEILTGFGNSLRYTPLVSLNKNIHFNGFDLTLLYSNIYDLNIDFPYQICGNEYRVKRGNTDVRNSLKTIAKNYDKFYDYEIKKELTFYDGNFYDNIGNLI